MNDVIDYSAGQHYNGLYTIAIVPEVYLYSKLYSSVSNCMEQTFVECNASTHLRQSRKRAGPSVCLLTQNTSALKNA
jgi:hypothetical protein